MFVGFDKLTPRYDSISKSSKRAESYPSTFASRLMATIWPSFWKGKNEENCAQVDIGSQDAMNMLKRDQRVVTFIENDRPLRGVVRFIGEDRDENGKLRTVVGLELVS